ncbi:MAG: 30S ribosome-binding factor RbfA [Chloroflexi bacterium]|nr:30S ribosome-binding factor RbfA [Chloroflexota bacterium]
MTRRIERVNHLIRQEICDLLQREVKDPRLGNLIVITGVTTSPDLKHAKVFVSHLGGEAEKAATLKVLSSAAGFLRRELAKRMQLRYVPELSFHWDESIERGAHIEELLDRISDKRC